MWPTIFFEALATRVWVKWNITRFMCRLVYSRPDGISIWGLLYVRRYIDSDTFALIYPLAAQYGTWVCGRSLVWIVGSNPTGGAWMSVCCEWCVLSGRGLCDGLITRSEKSCRLWCVCVSPSTATASRCRRSGWEWREKYSCCFPSFR
jgi:hypothetical protein